MSKLWNRIKYIFTDEYINFILEKVIYEIKVGSDQDIMKYALKYLDADYIKTSLLKQRFSEIYGDKIKGKYFLSEDIKTRTLNHTPHLFQQKRQTDSQKTEMANRLHLHKWHQL